MTETNRTNAMASDSASDGAADAQDQAVLTKDEEIVIAAGLTSEEAVCWKKAAETAGAFFNLPVLHSMDRQEVASAVHIIQNKLLSRPAYRRYLELAKQSQPDND